MKFKAVIALVAAIAVIGGILAYASGKSNSLNPSKENHYDVIVIGGEPEGVAAAVSAARNGAKTLLVEERDGLGGLMTFGKLNFIDMVQGIDKNSAVGGIFKEWHEQVGSGSAFEIIQAQEAFLKLVEDEPNITLALNTEFTDVHKDEINTVTGATLESAEGTKTVYGKRFIDATQDADFAVEAGAPYFVGGEDINLKDRFMAVTPVIQLSGVDWDGVRKAAEDEVFGPAEVTDSVAWGFSELHYDYRPAEENTRLRGLNLVRTKPEGQDEQFYINALQIFGVDGLDEQAKKQALEIGNREAEHITEYLRANFPGFEQAEISELPTELYVRETRHVISEYMLPMSDIWKNADHWDSIGYGGYPVDVQATSINDYGYVLSSPTQYAIPFRSLVPLEVENLVVVSRSAGYSSLAAGSARIIPTGMAAGEAGGAAAVHSILEDLTFRELSGHKEEMNELRYTLSRQGAMVDRFELPYPYQGKWFDESVQFLMDYGLVVGGYTNDLQVDEPLKALSFSNLLSSGLSRIDPTMHDQVAGKLNAANNKTGFDNQIFTRDSLASFLIEVFTSETPGPQPWEQAVEAGLINKKIYKQIAKDRELVRAEGFYVAYHLLSTVQKGDSLGK